MKYVDKDDEVQYAETIEEDSKWKLSCVRVCGLFLNV